LNAKIERVCKEIEKTKGKISEQQARLRELEKQKTELENVEIVDTVRGMDISFSDLAELLKSVRATSGQVGPKSEPPSKTESEDESE
jgi:DNA-binding transcriptional regulator YhcF (GntR family)